MPLLAHRSLQIYQLMGFILRHLSGLLAQPRTRSTNLARFASPGMNSGARKTTSANRASGRRNSSGQCSNRRSSDHINVSKAQRPTGKLELMIPVISNEACLVGGAGWGNK